MKSEITFDWNLIGAKLAILSDIEQAAFFTGFAKELEHFDTHSAREMQMMFVNMKLLDETKKTLREYLPSLWYKDGD